MEPADQHFDEGERACPHCGHVVPPLRYCVRCGLPLDPSVRRHGFAAQPDEPARALRLFSTLFPHLPRAGYDSFRQALALGLAVDTVLVIAGLFPLALVGAAILVPVRLPEAVVAGGSRSCQCPVQRQPPGA